MGKCPRRIIRRRLRRGGRKSRRIKRKRRKSLLSESNKDKQEKQNPLSLNFSGTKLYWILVMLGVLSQVRMEIALYSYCTNGVHSISIEKLHDYKN